MLSSPRKFGKLSRTKGNKFLQTPGKMTKILIGQNLPNPGSLSRESPASVLRSRGPRHLGGGEPENVTDLTIFLESFATRGTTSITEGMVYWALMKLLGPEGIEWVYQESRMGGRHQLGGAVVDFIVYVGVMSIGVRVQTYRFHMNADPRQKMHDASQLIALSDHRTVIVDIFEQDFVHDMTGQAIIKIMLEVINQRYRPDPIGTGMVAGTG
mgnify:CR=1 FL=1